MNFRAYAKVRGRKLKLEISEAHSLYPLRPVGSVGIGEQTFMAKTRVFESISAP
jgi:hypothetical protein